MNVTVRNVITSMRLISWFDWAEFVESVSLVDEVLRAGSSFARHGLRDARPVPARDRGAGPGLGADRGRGRPPGRGDGRRGAPTADEVDPSAGGATQRSRLLPDLRRPHRARARHWRPRAADRPAATRLRPRRRPAATSGRSRSSTALILAVPAAAVRGRAACRPGSSSSRSSRSARPPTSRSPSSTGRSRTCSGPKPLPRLELDDGVPTELRTLVVVPMLLTSEADVEAQVGGLEVHYLAQPRGRPAVRAAVGLARRADRAGPPATTSSSPPAAAAIDRLNERHGEAPGGGARFLLFHRKRTWNEAEGCWMGWERKRGKLQELNALAARIDDDRHPDDRPGRVDATAGRALRRHARRRHPAAAGRRGAPGRHDRPSAQPADLRPSGRPGHPRLRRAAAADHVRRCRPSTTRRSSSAIFSGSAGIDPYASAVSDVYQDLFREGSFTGKGIYDVDAFEAAMADRVPENALLSHDLFEGVFARAGLVTDIELFDEFPSNYLVSAARQHRWARGDWQLLPWILGQGPRRNGRARTAAPSRRIARWKMVDNLRRTLSAPLALATLVAAWTLPSVSAGAVDGVRPRSGGHPGCAAGACRAAAATAGHLQAQPRAGSRRRRRSSRRPRSGSGSRSSRTRRG